MPRKNDLLDEFDKMEKNDAERVFGLDKPRKRKQRRRGM